MTPSRSRRGRPPARAALALGAFALVASCEARRAPLAPPAAGPAPAPAPPGLSPVPPLPPATDARSAERAPGSGTERAPGSGAERAPGPGAERGPASGSERAPGSGAAIGAPQPLALPAFFGRLCDLRSGARTEHVRVAWLGDSHAAADLWTGAFRRRLQERYGNGGPGFLHLGWKARAPIRHDGVTFSTRSRWRLEPPAYSQTKRYDDGVLGLGGVRTLPLERDARARVEVSDPALRGETLRWTLSYRPLVASATAEVVLGDGKQQRLLAEGGEAGPAGATTPAGAAGKPGPAGATTPAGAAGKPGPAGSTAQTATPAGATTPAGLTTPGAAIGKGAPRQRTFRGPDAFEVRGGRGFQFFGVVAETEAPGLVVDTLGLNGARLSTMLAWDEPAWVSELARRRPDLVVVAFGTNESQEPAGDSRRFGNALEGVVGRARKAAPGAECLVVLPIERGDPAAQERLAVVSASLASRARALHCAIWDARAAMGGAGSLAAWQRETPARAAGDGVHLTTRGYLALGEALARDVFESAGRCEQRPSSPVERPVP